jgi:hypothetical protein
VDQPTLMKCTMLQGNIVFLLTCEVKPTMHGRYLDMLCSYLGKDVVFYYASIHGLCIDPYGYWSLPEVATWLFSFSTKRLRSPEVLQFRQLVNFE